MRIEPRSWDRSRDVWILAALVAASVAFYARTATFDFVDFDDTTVLLGQPNLFGSPSLSESLREMFFDGFPREEPLLTRDLSWLIEARLFGYPNPFGHHAGNVVLNGLVVGLLYILLRRWTGSRALSGGVSVAFAVVPVHVEAVSWVMGRKDLLVALFTLAGLLMQSIELGAPDSRRRWMAYLGTLVCCALALGSKISAISYPVVLAAHRAFQPCLEGRRDPGAPFEWRPALVRTALLLPHFLIAAGVFAWYRSVLSRFGVIEQGGPGALDPVHLTHVALFLPLIAGQYLISLFAPQDLSAYYRWPHVAIPLDTADLVAAGLWAVVILGGVAFSFWKRRDLAFFACFTLALMAPYTGLFYVGFWRADRYLYLASAGVLALAGVALRDAVRRVPMARAPAAALVAVFLVSSALISWHQQAVWRDNEALWTHEASLPDPSVQSFVALAKMYGKRAERAASREEREHWIAQTERMIGAGLARYEELDLRRGPYHVPEQLQLARLVELQASVAHDRGEPLSVSVALLRRAYEIAPNAHTALKLSRLLLEISDHIADRERREQLVRDSFDFFIEVVARRAGDPRALETYRRVLREGYGANYAFLEPEIANAQRLYFQ